MDAPPRGGRPGCDHFSTTGHEVIRQTERILVMCKGSSRPAALMGALEGKGWRAREVGDELAALEAVRSCGVDLAVLCCSLDEAVDMDLPRVLASVAGEAYLPVLIVTADPSEPQRAEYLDSGADDVVSRQICPAELLARVRALLRIKGLTDQLNDSRAALQEALTRERKLLAKLRADNAHLQKLANIDPLTHVQNVRSFQEILEHEFRAAQRYNRPLSLLMVDVDHFKLINDSYGHPSGDYVLKELAVILKQVTRSSDVISRVGGEEFTVLLSQADRRQSRSFAERIRQEVYDRKFTVFGEDIHVTVSLGIATYPADAEITRPQTLTRLADQALYHAKETGRDRVVGFHELPERQRRQIRRQLADEAFGPGAAAETPSREESEPADSAPAWTAGLGDDPLFE
jgi:diguanylate cyclase (GGDEF)-like protein